jgi:hypothetical protein
MAFFNTLNCMQVFENSENKCRNGGFFENQSKIGPGLIGRPSWRENRGPIEKGRIQGASNQVMDEHLVSKTI